MKINKTYLKDFYKRNLLPVFRYIGDRIFALVTLPLVVLNCIIALIVLAKNWSNKINKEDGI